MQKKGCFVFYLKTTCKEFYLINHSINLEINYQVHFNVSQKKQMHFKSGRSNPAYITVLSRSFTT